jgi:hypothetical protein
MNRGAGPPHAAARQAALPALMATKKGGDQICHGRGRGHDWSVCLLRLPLDELPPPRQGGQDRSPASGRMVELLAYSLALQPKHHVRLAAQRQAGEVGAADYRPSPPPELKTEMRSA